MDAVQVTLVQIDVIKRLTESYPQHLQLVRTADGEDRAELVGITTRMIMQNVAPPENMPLLLGSECLFGETSMVCVALSAGNVHKLVLQGQGQRCPRVAAGPNQPKRPIHAT